MASDPLAQFVEGHGPYLFRRGKTIDRRKRKRHTVFSLHAHFLSVSQRDLWRTMQIVRKDQSIKRSDRANPGKMARSLRNERPASSVPDKQAVLLRLLVLRQLFVQWPNALSSSFHI